MTNKSFKILTFIKDNQDTDWVNVLNSLHPEFSYEDTSSVLEKLIDDNLVENPCHADRPPLCKLRITKLGRIALHAEEDLRLTEYKLREEAHLRKAEIQSKYERQIKSLDEIAAASKKQAELAVAQARAAEEDSKLALKVSKTSNRIACASLVLSFVMWFFTKEELADLISSFAEWIQGYF